mmetsp:Transcript_26288/g.30032  ORF Transcript_26288/g.30032 Transcript_26288/m.30032 type:complete len:151 (+) Transcript_26288:125-577(+)
MANESTQLVEQTKERLSVVGSAVNVKIRDFAKMAKEGTTSIRGLALISGLALVVSSFSDFVKNILTLHFISAVINFYTFFIGGVAIIMEVDPKAIPYGEEVRAWLMKYIGIVQLSTGRGVFYGVAGTLAISQTQTDSPLNCWTSKLSLTI